MHKDLSNKHYTGMLTFLEYAEKQSQEWIHQYQLHRLKDTVKNAFLTPGYKALYQNKPEINTLDDLSRLPFLTREMLRDDFESFSLPLPGRYKTSTGGSSGIPISLYHTPETFAQELASKAHQYKRIGWKESDKQLTLRGLQIDTPNKTEYVPELNELRCSSFYLVPDQMKIYYELSKTFSPEWLRCYPSSGYLFARWLSDNDLKMSLKGVLCASEKLYAFQKELMSQVFDCRVFSHYGNYEFAALAGFCEQSDTYHVMPTYGIVELIDDNGKQVTEIGKVGEIVATSFVARATPIIRYRTGDLAIYGGKHCSDCDRHNTILLDIEGRRWEYIITKSGRKISPAALNNHDDLYKHLRQFRYHQKEIGKVIFCFVPKPDFTSSMLTPLYWKVQKKLGDFEDIEVEMYSAKELPLSIRGKHGFLVQELDVY